MNVEQLKEESGGWLPYIKHGVGETTIQMGDWLYPATKEEYDEWVLLPY